MTEITNLNDLFPASTSSIISVSTDSGTRTYTLLVDLTVTTSDLTPATIPSNVGHVVFDGGNHTVNYSNNNHTNGLFDTEDDVNYDITIKNLGITNGKTRNNNGFICTTEFAKDATSNITIDNCYSTGSINGEDSGGIVGSYFGMGTTSSLIIQNCYSTGNIINFYAGGIVGSYFGKNSSSTILIQNCYSTGGILTEQAGGIASRYCRQGGSGIIIITKCYSTGDIKEAGGGIVSSYAADNASGGIFLITECYSTGNNNGTVGSGTGGIVGKFACNNANSITFSIKNCYSTGVISTSKSGGIIGSDFGDSSSSSTYIFENCYSSGSVSGTNAGGIAGPLGSGTNNTFTFTNVYSNAATDGYTNISSHISNPPADYAAFISNITNSSWYTSVTRPILDWQTQKDDFESIVVLFNDDYKLGDSIDISSISDFTLDINDGSTDTTGTTNHELNSATAHTVTIKYTDLNGTETEYDTVLGFNVKSTQQLIDVLSAYITNNSEKFISHSTSSDSTITVSDNYQIEV